MYICLLSTLSLIQICLGKNFRQIYRWKYLNVQLLYIIGKCVFGYYEKAN